MYSHNGLDPFLIINPDESHDIRYFAGLNNAVAINDTNMEGGNAYHGIRYYNYLLHMEIPNCPIDFNLPSEQMDAVDTAMEKLLNTAQQLEIEEDKFQKEIKKYCKEAICYLPSGWKGSSGGHFAALKLRRMENGHSAISVINQGDGLQYHRMVEGKKKIKYIYQSDEYEIDLESEQGLECIKMIMSLNKKINKLEEKKINPYSADDLYGILEVYGNKIPLKDKLSEKVVTAQRSGTCVMTNTNAVARDKLIDMGADLKSRKRYRFVLKLRSIILAIHYYRKNKCSAQVLDWALREFAVRLNKEYRHTLSDEEMIWCGKLLDKIRHELDANNQNELAKKCQLRPLPLMTDNAATNTKNISNEVNKINVGNKVEIPRPLDIYIISYDPGKDFQPEEIIKIRPETPEDAYAIFDSLPVCSGLEKDTFWDRVPEKDIEQIMRNFAAIEEKCLLANNATEKMIALSLIAYDIAAQLSQRLKGLKLGTQYALALENVYSDYIFHDPFVYFTVKRVLKNFEQRCQGVSIIFVNSLESSESNIDKTIHYIVNEMITDEVRIAVKKGIMEKQRRNYCNDSDIFQYFIEGHLQLNNKYKYQIESLLTLSGSAHSKGKYCKIYKKTMLFSFDEHSPYNNKYSRNLHLFTAQVKNKIPQIKQQIDVAHKDFSENTIYLPEDELKYIQSRKSIRLKLEPWQLELSGSIHPDSKAWKLDETTDIKSYHREMDEDFRHLECSPQLRVVRTLAWLKNHLAMLKDQRARIRISELIFQYGQLDDAIVNQFEIVLYNIRLTLSAILKYCNEEDDTDVLIWSANFAYELRNYLEVAATVYNLPIGEIYLSSFQDLLHKKIMTSDDASHLSRLASLMIRDFYLADSLSLNDGCLLLVCRITENLGDDRNASDLVWKKINYQLIEVIKNSDSAMMSERLNDYLAKYLKMKVNKQWKVVENKLMMVDWEGYINLDTGTIQHGKDSLKDYTNEAIMNNKEFFAELKLDNTNITLLGSNWELGKGGALLSADGRWEFVFNTNTYKGYTNTIQVYQWITIDGVRRKFKLMIEKDDINSSFRNGNPFESQESTGQFHQYWEFEKGRSQSADEIIVCDRYDDLSYYYTNTVGKIYQLHMKAHGEWLKNGNEMLNLTRGGNTSLENQWATWLAPLVGIKNIHCIARLDNDNKSRQIQSIHQLLLNLNFSIDENMRITCEQVPGFYLTEQYGMKILHGYTGIIRLENSKGEEKFILPAFALNKGEKNNAFNLENIVNQDKLCRPSCPWFVLTLDSNQQLKADSVEANLYLAILYRSLGNFKQAFSYLQLCHSAKNINETIFSIAMQILTRKIKSPLGAAFDLKLECYLREHQGKWVANDHQVFNFPDDWTSWINEQLQFYMQTFSDYKTEVAIFPAYCRLTMDDFEWLNEKTESKHESKSLAMNSFSIGIRLKNAGKLPALDVLRTYERSFKITRTKSPVIKDLMTSWRILPKGIDDKIALEYLFMTFDSLFKQAISEDPIIVRNLYITLFRILQNDVEVEELTNQLVGLLVHTSKNPKLFSSFTISEDKSTLMIEIAKVLHDNYSKDEILNRNEFLIQPFTSFEIIDLRQSLPQDYVAAESHFAISNIPNETEYQFPLEVVFKKFIERKNMTVASSEFALNINDMPDADPIETRIVNQYKKGHDANLKKIKPLYKIKADKTLAELKNILTQIKDDDLKLAKEYESKIIEKANRLPLSHESSELRSLAYNLLQSRISEQLPEIRISDVVQSFLEHDSQMLTQRNPFLTQITIEELYADFAAYALGESRIAQISQLLEKLEEANSFTELENFKIQEIAEILDKRRAYEIRKWPEFLIYEYATGKILRQDQVEILIKIINLIESGIHDKNVDEYFHCLLQFAAGGGKTSVLIPILAHRFARMGLLPVIINTMELYQIGLSDIPKNLQASFKQNMEVIERDLEHRWTKDEMHQLLKDLQRWKKQKKCLLIKPVTWHSLNIAYKIAHCELDQTGFKTAAMELLDFFKENTVKLEDECQITSDPLQKYIKTFGNLVAMPEDQLTLILTFYDILMGYADESSKIASIAAMRSKRERQIHGAELEFLQTELANRIIRHSLFEKIRHENLRDYLLQDSRKRPQWLIKLYYGIYKNNKDLANLIVTARAFLKNHLPHILNNMEFEDNFGQSIHAGDLTAAPKHNGNSVSLHFADPVLISALSTQMYYRIGLQPYQIKQLFQHLLKQHYEERLWNKNMNAPTVAEAWLLTMIPDEYTFSSYLDLDASLKNDLSIDPVFCKQHEVIKKYLVELVFPQIMTPEKRQESSAAEFQTGFKFSVKVSATPELQEIYSAILESYNCFLEEEFEAQVIDVLLHTKNQGHLPIQQMKTAAKFFDQFPDDLLSKMTTLIDRGGLMLDFDAGDLINTYLDLVTIQKPVAAQTAAFFSKTHLHLKTRSAEVKEVDITGAGLVEALKQQNIKPEQFILFLFLELSKTTGVDIKRPHFDHAGLTIGSRQTMTEIIQAIMRERQILVDDAQSFTWIMFKLLYQEICTDTDKFDPRKICYWAIKNLAIVLKPKIINRAYQGIDQIYTKIALEGDPLELAQNQYQKLEAWDNYEIDSVEKDTEIVLNDYVDKKLHQMKIISKDSYLINKIITDTIALIPKLPDIPESSLNNQIEQEMQITVSNQNELELHQQSKSAHDAIRDFVFQLEQYSIEKDNFTSIFKEGSYYQKLLLPGCDDINQPELFYCKEHFSAYQSTDAKLTQLKPIKMLLIRIDYNHMDFAACSAAGAEYFSFLINNELLNTDFPAYAIISSDGDVLCTSNNISFSLCKDFVNSDNCQRMLAYTNFLNGKVRDPLILSHLIRDYHLSKQQYEQVLEVICAIHVSKSPVYWLDYQFLQELSNKQVAAKESVNDRYINPLENIRNIQRMRELRHVNIRDNKFDNLLITIQHPNRILDKYLFEYQFSHTPSPIKPTPKSEVELSNFFREMYKATTEIQERQLVILKFIHEANSLLPPDQKRQRLKSSYNEFFITDMMLIALYYKVSNYSSDEYRDYKNQTIKSIVQFYVDYANGIPPLTCKERFVSMIKALSSTLADNKSGHNLNMLSSNPKANPLALMLKNILLELNPESKQVRKKF